MPQKARAKLSPDFDLYYLYVLCFITIKENDFGVAYLIKDIR